MNDKSTFKIWYEEPSSSAWHHVITDIEPIEGKDGEYRARNYDLLREDGKFGHHTLVTDSYLKDGQEIPFIKPLFFEATDKTHPDRCGDAVVVLRLSPDERWHVDADVEKHYIDENTIEVNMRLTRSSGDNVKKAVKRPVRRTGDRTSNSARQGGEKIAVHFVIANWSPQLKSNGGTVDVYEFGQRHVDLIGGGAFFEAMINLPDKVGNVIFDQLRYPPKDLE